MADEVFPGTNGDQADQMPTRSISDRAQDEPVQEEFPKGVVDAGASKRSLKTLIKGGLPVEMTVSMMSAEVPLRGGIPDPEAQHRFVVTTELHKAEPIAQREEGLLTAWKVRAHLRPVYVEAVEAHQVVVGLGRETFDAFERQARERGTSASALAAELLSEFVKQPVAG